MKKFDVESVVVRGSDNSIDHSGSADAFAAALVEFEVSEVARNLALKEKFGAIAVAVAEVFAQYPGVCINQPALVSFSMAKLPNDMKTPKAYKETAALCESYIQECSKEGGTILSKKGPGQGCRLIADMKPADSKQYFRIEFMVANLLNDWEQ